MAITWEEIKSHIDFPSIYLNSYLYLEPGDADNLLLPDRNFSAIEKDKILESLHQLFDNSPTAQAELSSYFTPNIFGITNDLNIYPNAAKKGVWTKTDNIFLDFDYILTNPIPGNYLTLLGTISSYHLGSVIYHEFLHVSDNKSAKAPPPVEVLNRNNLEAIRAAYSDPYFDHLGSVVSRTNIVMSEVGEKPRGSYAGMRHLNDTVIKDYIVSLEEKISGRYYDQAILLLTGEPVATFISDGRIIDGSPSRDLIISLQESNNITTGGGDDVVVGGFGNDTVNGGSGVDYLIGRDGNDTFNSVGFGDVIAGGAGIDTAVLDLTSQITGVTVNHLAGVGAGAAWTGVEYVGGMLGQGDDNVTAGMQLTRIDGYTGTDTLTLDYSGVLPDGRTATRLDFGYLWASNNEYVYLSDGTSPWFDLASFERFNIIATAGNDTITGGVAGNTLFGKDGDDALTGGAGVDVLDGGNGNDTLSGLAGVDTLNGGDGNDTLNGGADTSADVLNGGAGNDTFNSVGFGDVVTGGTGIDTAVLGLTNQTAGVTVNHLAGVGAGAAWTGVEYVGGMLGQGDDNVTAGMQLTRIDGYTGTDTLTLDYSGVLPDGRTATRLDFGYLWASNNEYVYLSDGTSPWFDLASFERFNIIATAGNDTITGGVAGNTLFGKDGNDTLTGSTGVDVLDGGNGNDVLNGDQGNDTLIGWAGVDTMIGGLGDDIYLVENTGDVVTENLNAGTDTVSSRLAYTLPAHVENLTLTGTEVINGTGNDLNNVITGNSAANQLNGQAGNDTLNGGGGDDTLTGWSGADTMIGGAGNDTYLVENVGDVVTEALNQGVDTVSSRLTYTLPANVENLTLTGTAVINGTGNGQANKITGNSAANQLNGGAGNDTLDGGAGINVLTGGTGNDIFKFTTKGHVDRITDFNVLNDTFQLENSVFTAFTTAGILAATQFRIGTQALDADDFVIYNNATGALLYDANGNGAGAGVQIATLSAGLAITNADIVVI